MQHCDLIMTNFVANIYIVTLVVNLAASDYELAHSKSATEYPTTLSTMASLAVDGNLNTYSWAADGGGSSKIAWWQVDLGGIYQVTNLLLFNTGLIDNNPYVSGSLCNFVVIIGITNSTTYNGDASSPNVCYLYANSTPVAPGGNISIDCMKKPTPGRYVTISRLSGGWRQDMISLREVYVYTGENVYDICHYKPATQNNTYDGDNDQLTYGASKAVDGDVSTCAFVAVGGQSSSYIAWWQVDLVETYAVTSVAIINTHQVYLSTEYVYTSDFTVSVDPSSSTNDLGPSRRCYTYPADGPLALVSGQQMSLTCKNQPLSGRYVTVRRTNGTYRADALALCEFFVYGYQDNPSSTEPTTTTSETTMTTTSLTTKSSTILNPITRLTQPPGSFPPSSSSQGLSQSTTTRSETISSTTTLPSNVSASNVDSSPSAQPADSHKEAIIIGVVVGFVFLVALIILVVFLIRRFSNHSLFRKPERPLIVVDLPNTKYVEKKSVKGYTAVQRNIKLEDLNSYIQNRKNGGFVSEFKELPEEDLEIATVSKSPDNCKKNRFQNVLPYDDNLVPLLVDEDDDPNDTYINASFMTGYRDVEKMYIATQGPKALTVKDIWRMIWQQNINTIVMVTPLIENQKRRCEQYWPENLHETKVYHKISVTLAVEEVYADYVYRQLVVNDTRKRGEQSRIVRHMHFVSWADKNRPEHGFPLLAFRHRVKNLPDVMTGPLLVHCSAGIGRTGTYIAIDYLLNQAEEENEISVFRCVKEMRFQRMNMVQTADQYEFVYEAVLEGVTDGNKGIPCLAFNEQYEDLKKMKKDEATSKLEEQFKLLNEKRKIKPGRQSLGTKDKNIARNRNKSIVAYDDCRPYLQTTAAMSKSDYINAVFVDGYRSKDAYILTQVPLPNTIIDFWGLVWDHCLETIVLLEDLDGADESSPIYWPEGSASETYGQFDVELISVNKESPTVWLRQFTLTNSKDRSAEPMNVLQYQFAPDIWLNKFSIPSKTSSILQLTKFLTNNTGKIILQCSDGASRSGLVAAAMHMIDMMKVEQIVDVFLVCRYIIVNRPQAIDDLNQYRFLHDLALECINEHDQYDNLQSATIYVNLPSP